MQILHEKPPVWIEQSCLTLFGASYEKGAIFTYEPNIYAKEPLPEDWIVHENVHIRQQEAVGAEEWWIRYFDDRTFRMSQELEAYREQYKFVTSYCTDKNMLDQCLRKFAMELSTVYKLEINQLQAYKLIKNK